MVCVLQMKQRWIQPVLVVHRIVSHLVQVVRIRTAVVLAYRVALVIPVTAKQVSFQLRHTTIIIVIKKRHIYAVDKFYYFENNFYAVMITTNHDLNLL